MTNEQFWARYNDIKRQIDDDLRDYAISILKTGAIDLGRAEDDFQLPKIILNAGLLHEADQWEPFSTEGKRQVKNLSRF